MVILSINFLVFFCGWLVDHTKLVLVDYNCNYKRKSCYTVIGPTEEKLCHWRKKGSLDACRQD